MIREILDLYDCDDGEVRQNLHARAKLIERIDVLERQKIDIAMALSELRRAVRRMDARSPWTFAAASVPAGAERAGAIIAAMRPMRPLAARSLAHTRMCRDSVDAASSAT